MSKTKEKYMTALLYASSVAEFHSRDFAKSFKLSHNVITAMHELGLIQKIGNGKYCWIIRRAPSPFDVVSIRKRLAAYNATARKSNGQLTIKAIKNPQHQARAQAIIDEAKRIVSERTQPVPESIIELNEKISEYPILDVAIAFLGGMVVAAFFTLIWK